MNNTIFYFAVLDTFIFIIFAIIWHRRDPLNTSIKIVFVAIALAHCIYLYYVARNG